LGQEYIHRAGVDRTRIVIEAYLDEHWTSDKCLAVLHIIWPTSPPDPDLRGMINKIVIRQLPSLEDHREFLTFLGDNTEFTYDIILSLIMKVRELGERQ
jgi:hypothetical protein